MESLNSQSVSHLTYSVIGWTHLASPWTHIRQCACMQSCPILCDPIDCSPPGSSVHGILQARILEWVAISFSRGSSQAEWGPKIKAASMPGNLLATCWPCVRHFVVLQALTFVTSWTVALQAPLPILILGYLSYILICNDSAYQYVKVFT